MHRFSKIVFLVSLIVILVGFPMAASAYSPAAQLAAVSTEIHWLQDAEPTVPDLAAIVDTLFSLGGVALLGAAIINGGKRLMPRWFPDNSAPVYTLIFQTAGLVTLVILQLTGRTDLIPIIDANSGVLANALTAIVALVYQLFVSRKGHEDVLAGLPVIGTSYSRRKAGEEIIYSEAVDVAV